MTKRERFMMLVSAFGCAMTTNKTHLTWAIDEALKVNPDTLPDDVPQAARDFMGFKLALHAEDEKKPKWLATVN